MSFARLSAALADRYRIERELGAGGMATVYLAHDLRHDRDVAIKVLHPDLGAALGSERFLSEIRTTARLQHPHILPLLDSGEADRLLYYVMPYVTGETLRARLEREQQLPIDVALRIGREVADALGSAHAAGIIHRDIKPENILLQGGHALVADFGIALAVQSAGGHRMTQTGLSLGTPQYMSPEQAMGERTVDARTDIYALGAVTYEMLAGDPPFTGSSVQAIVAKVLNERPTSLHMLRDTVPEHVDAAVLRAIAKLPADRFATAAEFAAALGTDHFTASGSRPIASDNARALRRTRRAFAGSSAVAMAAVAAAVLVWRRPAASSEVAVHRLELTAPVDLPFAFPVFGTISDLALSPGGDRVAFTVRRPDGWALAVRNLDQLAARLLPGTEGASHPEFSPDGRWIAFESADGMLKKIAIDGASLTTICAVGPSGSGGLSWMSDREIAFSKRAISSTPGMFRVSADGGTPAVFSRVDTASGERFQVAPRAVDSGRLVFYTSTRASAVDVRIGVVNVADGRTKVFTDLRGSRALGLVDDALIYVRADGALMAVPFNARALTVGTPIQVGDSLAVSSWNAAAGLSQSGAIVYQQGGSAGQLVRVNLHGDASVLVDSVRQYVHPRFSPDGRRLAFEVNVAGGSDIWTSDLAAKTMERLTTGGIDDRPEWTPDGRRVLFTSSREAALATWWQPADGSAPATKLHAASDPIREAVITPDGRGLVYRTDSPTNNRDIWMVPLTGTRTPVPLVVTVNDDKEPRVSPDSRWLAYVSNESGREEVYVRPLAAVGGRVLVSTNGAGEPLWAPDSRRVFYRTGNRVMEATLATAPTMSVTARRVVFAGAYASDIYHPDYDVAPDGASFVMVRPVESSRRVVIVVNWARELRRRMAGTRW